MIPVACPRSPGIFIEKMIANPKNDATASCDTEDALCSDHRIPANTYTWRMRTSCPSFTDCLHEMSVPTSCGCTPGPSSCPTQLSVDLAVFQQCTGCLLCKLRESAKWYPWLATIVTIGIFPWENDMILNPKNDAPASCDTEEARCSLFRPSKTTNTFYSDTPLVVRCQIGRLAHSDLLLFRSLNSKSPCCQVSHHRSDLDITRRRGHEIRVWAEVLELPRGSAKWYLWLATIIRHIPLRKRYDTEPQKRCPCKLWHRRGTLLVVSAIEDHEYLLFWHSVGCQVSNWQAGAQRPAFIPQP